ncbi:UNVERIFIED_CONTAM: hypothetical protein Slati_1135000 [Sesamum latifolium]|uniref:Secreted protein n=1 Tax=Sesamum latifolium TaxID=2727402 RepID=A0AAW2XCQ8_9LAMI
MRAFGPLLEWAFEVVSLGLGLLRSEASSTNGLGWGLLGRIYHSVPPTLRRRNVSRILLRVGVAFARV